MTTALERQIKNMRTTAPYALDAHEVAEVIGTDIEDWPGKCSLIATKLKSKLLPKARYCYGHYFGPCSIRSLFFDMMGKTGFCQHAWLELADGTIVDPTRWAFETDNPDEAYIYVGPSDVYDEGGNKLREAMYGEQPVPEFDENDEPLTLKLCKDSIAVLRGIGFVTAPKLCERQILYLGNINPNRFLRPIVEDIYKALVRAKRSYYIPLDNQRKYGIE